MINEQYKIWWKKYDDVEKCRLVKDKSIEINNSHKKMVNATNREIEFGFNRTGVRGGKFTTLSANSQRATETYLRGIEELRYMIGTL